MPDVHDRQQGIPTGRVGKMFNVCVGKVKVWAYQMDRLSMPIHNLTSPHIIILLADRLQLG